MQNCLFPLIILCALLAPSSATFGHPSHSSMERENSTTAQTSSSSPGTLQTAQPDSDDLRIKDQEITQKSSPTSPEDSAKVSHQKHPSLKQEDILYYMTFIPFSGCSLL